MTTGYAAPPSVECVAPWRGRPPALRGVAGENRARSGAFRAFLILTA